MAFSVLRQKYILLGGFFFCHDCLKAEAGYYCLVVYQKHILLIPVTYICGHMTQIRGLIEAVDRLIQSMAFLITDSFLKNTSLKQIAETTEQGISRAISIGTFKKI